MLVFTPNNADFPSLSWLCNSSNTDKSQLDDRPVLGRISVEPHENHIACVHTDSLRLSIVRYKSENDCPLEKGVYDVVSNKKDEILLERLKDSWYLNWQSIIPDKSKMRRIFRPSGDDFTFHSGGGYDDLMLDIYYAISQGARVDYEWLEKVGAFFSAEWKVFVEDKKEKYKLILLECKTHKPTPAEYTFVAMDIGGNK